jgi:hypothetical protein
MWHELNSDGSFPLKMEQFIILVFEVAAVTNNDGDDDDDDTDLFH